MFNLTAEHPRKGWVNEPIDQYHADPLTVSSSKLRKILKSPASFKASMSPDFQWPESDAMRFGFIFHNVILDKADLSSFVVMPKFEGHHASNVHKIAKATWLQDHQGQTVVTETEFRAIEGMAQSIRDHKDAHALLSGGLAETSGYYTDPQTGINCRIRPDFINTKTNAIVDLKTCREGTFDAFRKSIFGFRYDFQMAMYGAGYEAIEKKPADYYVFIAVEKEPPYECFVYVLDIEVLARARGHYFQALDTLKVCLEANHWPMAQTQVQSVGLPPWEAP